MPVRLVLLCHGKTTTRPSFFPDDEPLAPGEAGGIAALAHRFGAFGPVIAAPSLAARQTASAFRPDPLIEPAIRDADLGRWKGRAIGHVERTEPGALEEWLSDPGFAAHGGESRSEVFARVGEWIDKRIAGEDTALAVSHPSVIRAAILHVLAAPPASVRHLDVRPLDALDLRSDGRRWTIRSLGPFRTMEREKLDDGRQDLGNGALGVD